MPLPDLDERGLLPAGSYDATLRDIADRFCATPARQALWAKASAFLPALQAMAGGQPLLLAGSFFSDKANPDDIEVTIVAGNNPRLIGESLLLFNRHDEIKALHGLDFYPTLPGNSDFTEFFQYVGPKTAQAKNLRPTDRRGIVRVI